MCICGLFLVPSPFHKQLIILLCSGSLPHVFEPENLKGFSYLLRGAVNNTGQLGTDVLESFSMVDQNLKEKTKTNQTEPKTNKQENLKPTQIA